MWQNCDGVLCVGCVFKVPGNGRNELQSTLSSQFDILYPEVDGHIQQSPLSMPYVLTNR